MLLAPVGADETAVSYLDLGGVAQVAVTGTAVETAGLLCSWLETLAAAATAESFGIATASSRGEVQALVDQTGVPRWPGDDAATGPETAAALERELARRSAGMDPAAGMPLIVALVDSDTGDDPGRVETLLRRGPRGRILPVVLRAPSAPAGAPDDLLASCEIQIIFAAAGATGEPGTLQLVVADQPPLALRPVLVPSDAAHPRRPAAVADDEAPAADAPLVGMVTVPSVRPATRNGTHAEQEDGHALGGGDGDLSLSVHHPTNGKVSPRPTAAVAVTAVARPGDDDSDARVPRRDLMLAAAPVEPASPAASARRAHPDEGDATGDAADTAVEDGPRFTVRCLGGFEVELDGTPVSNWRSQKARELLAYLIAHGDGPVLREEAWSALWPELGADRMQRLLSAAAFRLRRTFRDAAGREEIDPLITQDGHYRLRMPLFRIDLTSFDARLRRATKQTGVDALIGYERALALYRGPLLGTEPFDWAGGRRREVEKRFLDAAHTAARLAIQSRDGQRAISLYQLILSREELDEEAARALMSCYADQGDVNSVRKVYKALVDAIRQEFDDPNAEPLPETVALMREVTQARH